MFDSHVYFHSFIIYPRPEFIMLDELILFSQHWILSVTVYVNINNNKNQWKKFNIKEFNWFNLTVDELFDTLITITFLDSIMNGINSSMLIVS